MSSTDGSTAEDTLVEVVALLEAAERRLNRLGSQQQMSVGPALGELQQFKETVHQRGVNYGIINKSTTLNDLRAAARTEYDLNAVVEVDDE